MFYNHVSQRFQSCCATKKCATTLRSQHNNFEISAQQLWDLSATALRSQRNNFEITAQLLWDLSATILRSQRNNFDISAQQLWNLSATTLRSQRNNFEISQACLVFDKNLKKEKTNDSEWLRFDIPTRKISEKTH